MSMNCQNESKKNFAKKLFYCIASILLIACKGNGKETNNATNFNEHVEKVKVEFSTSDESLGKIIAQNEDGEEIASGNEVEKGATITFFAQEKENGEIYKWHVNNAEKTERLREKTLRIDASENLNVKATFRNPLKIQVDGIETEFVSFPDLKDIELGYADNSENVPHKLSISSYLIAKTETTQELFEKVMHFNPSGSFKPAAKNEIQGKRPVERVSWFDACLFCNELTRLVDGSSIQCVYSIEEIKREDAEVPERITSAIVTADWRKKGFRLPTEAEWEWAARGGGSTKWAQTNSEADLAEYAWFLKSSRGKTHQVAKLTPNSYGLYDITGNVWEWCWDLYENITELDEDLGLDYKGAEKGTDRSYRGGGFVNPYIPCAIGFRNAGFEPKMAVDSLGFRIVRSR